MKELAMFDIPTCEACLIYHGTYVKAAYDSRTTLHLMPTAYLCQSHFNEYGIAKDSALKITQRPSIFDKAGE